MPRPGRFTPGNSTLPAVQEAGSAPQSVRTAEENFVPTAVRSPDHSARSK